MESEPKTEKTNINFMTALAKRRLLIIGIIVSLISTVIISYRQSEIIERQQKLEREISEMRLMQQHSNETDFALRLTGMKQTATITENAMQTFYKRNLELIAHCKVIKTCRLPTSLSIIEPLPNYVPIAAIYLQEKQKISKENY